MDYPIETTASNIIESSINLLNRIAETYDDATANELERRFLNSIRTGDPASLNVLWLRLLKVKRMKTNDILNEKS